MPREGPMRIKPLFLGIGITEQTFIYSVISL